MLQEETAPDLESPFLPGPWILSLVTDSWTPGVAAGLTGACEEVPVGDQPGEHSQWPSPWQGPGTAEAAPHTPG